MTTLEKPRIDQLIHDSLSDNARHWYNGGTGTRLMDEIRNAVARVEEFETQVDCEAYKRQYPDSPAYWRRIRLSNGGLIAALNETLPNGRREAPAGSVQEAINREVGHNVWQERSPEFTTIVVD